MNRRPPSSIDWFVWLRAGIVAATAMVFLIVGLLALVSAVPRLLPLVIVAALGGAVVLWLYRDHLIRRT